MKRVLVCIVLCSHASAAHARDRFVLEAGLGIGPLRTAKENADGIPIGPGETQFGIGWTLGIGGYLSENVSLTLRVVGVVDRAAWMTMTLTGPHVRYTRDRLWFGGGLGWGTAFGYRGKADSIENTLGLGLCARAGVEIVRHRIAALSVGVEASWTVFAPDAGPEPGPLSILLGVSYEVR